MTPMTEPVLGVLMLNTKFPRPPGDIGNAATWPFPVAFEIVEAALVGRVVSAEPPTELLLPPFVAAGESLVAKGVRAITTSCGFLALFQKQLTEALAVPVMTSSLQQTALVQASLPRGKRVGIVTIDAAQLSPAHLASAGVAPGTPIAGVENGRELHRIIMADLEELDTAAAEADVLAAGDALLKSAPDVGAVVLECTNMSPYARTLARHLGLPVYDIVSLVTWFFGGADPREWG